MKDDQEKLKIRPDVQTAVYLSYLGIENLRSTCFGFEDV
jgi:hypothetical protein